MCRLIVYLSCVGALEELSQCATLFDLLHLLPLRDRQLFFYFAWKTSEHSASPAFSLAYLGPRATCFFANVGKLPPLYVSTPKKERPETKEEGRTEGEKQSYKTSNKEEDLERKLRFAISIECEEKRGRVRARSYAT